MYLFFMGIDLVSDPYLCFMGIYLVSDPVFVLYGYRFSERSCMCVLWV
jgi:hypothetical protein